MTPHTAPTSDHAVGRRAPDGRSQSLSVAGRALSAPIRVYQAVRAGRPSPCRYWPTCSTYALEAIADRGAVRGLALAVRRLLRCQPWARSSGFDPVPEAGR